MTQDCDSRWWDAAGQGHGASAKLRVAWRLQQVRHRGPAQCCPGGCLSGSGGMSELGASPGLRSEPSAAVSPCTLGFGCSKSPSVALDPPKLQ